MSARRIALFTSAVLMGAVLTACAGPGDGGSDKVESPLQKIFAQLDGSNLTPEEQEQRWAEQNAKNEELVAECMQKEGFEYVPATNNGAVSFGNGGEWEPDKREWVAQYGYGAVNFPGRDDQPQPETEWVDPNYDYVMSLSEAEQTAYYEVLYGAPMDDPEAEWTWENGGCHGWAGNQNQETNVWSSAEATAFFDALNAFQEQTPSDPRIDEVNAEWASCMSDAGFSGFAAQQDAQNSIYDELNGFYENQTEFIENDPALDKIQEKEIELALADLDCRNSVNYTKRSQEALFEGEEKFIAEHKAEIDALLALAAKSK